MMTFASRSTSANFLPTLGLSALLLASQLGAGESDVAALLAEARSDDPARRFAAYAALREAGGPARHRLSLQLDGQLRRAVNQYARLLSSPRVKSEAARLTVVLEASRQKALALIFDEAAYPDGTTSGAAQEAVEAASAEVERAWAARREGVLQAEPGLAQTHAEAREFAEALAALSTSLTGGLPRCFELEALFERVVEPERLAAWPALGANAWGPWEAGPAERAVLAQVNRYRLRLGLPVLKFDARLFRAAAWFARHSAEHDLRSHFCDVEGKRDPAQRAEAEGHRKCVGEALAFNGTHVSDWLASAAHRRVLSDRQAVDGAVAIYAHVAVLVTGQSDPPRSLPAGSATGDQFLWEDMARATWDGPRQIRLLRLARFLHGLGRKPESARVWREVSRLLPDWEEARKGLGEVRGPDGTWWPANQQQRAKDPQRLARLQNWSADLSGTDVAKRLAALERVAEDDARELSAAVWTLADPGQAPDFESLRAALLCAARLALPGVEEHALSLLTAADTRQRALGAELAEHCGGLRSLDAMIGMLETNLSEYAVLRAIETMTGRLTRMDFRDDRDLRVAKVKALAAWWQTERPRYVLDQTSGSK